jgi:hypothetical protein
VKLQLEMIVGGSDWRSNNLTMVDLLLMNLGTAKCDCEKVAVESMSLDAGQVCLSLVCDQAMSFGRKTSCIGIRSVNVVWWGWGLFSVRSGALVMIGVSLRVG